MTDFHVVIPARYGSTRLPGKPLIPLAGIPMVQHVVACAQKSQAKSVTVATDDVRILEAVKAFGGEVLLTSYAHESGTDRLQEVAKRLNFADDDIVVNVQGDEPLIPASVIRQVATNLAVHKEASVATLFEPLSLRADIDNPNIVKVVVDQQGLGLYFSRAPIPFEREPNKGNELSAPYYRHVGLYAYRVSLLHQFVQWPMGVLERAEKLEQLRVLENGHRIHLARACESFAGGVDTLEDVARVEQLLRDMN